MAIVVLLVLAAVSLAVASCGSSSTTGIGSSSTATGQLSGKAQVDSYLQQLDQQMNSVTGEFDENQLSNKELGY